MGSDEKLREETTFGLSPSPESDECLVVHEPFSDLSCTLGADEISTHAVQ